MATKMCQARGSQWLGQLAGSTVESLVLIGLAALD